jgi:hypothetical protein
MAQRNEQVIEFVRAELRNQPDLGSRALFERAQEIDPSLSSESVQQFHARYVLPVKRERKPGVARKQSQAKSSRAEEKPKGARKSSRRDRGAESAAVAPSGPQQGGEAEIREAVRGVFIRFAQEFGSAESRSDIIRVMGDIDKYVEQVVRKLR